jgi:dTDP-4-amino-4,6-dideoxygalactose transaminase
MLADKLGRPAENVLMMTSGSHALEASLQVIGLTPGDEVIVPSYSYPSAANAVLLAGGQVVYAEVEPVHLNLDPQRLPGLITARTRAVIVVHYGGICCDMAPIQELSRKHGLIVIEDCAQSFQSEDRGFKSGTIGDFGCFSFHGTKDIVAGEGGALVVNNPEYARATRVFRQKGTNRDAFTGGQVSFYEWIAPGSSYAPAELAMALLLAQLEQSDAILAAKSRLFDRYETFCKGLPRVTRQTAGLLSFSTAASHGFGNGHLFFLVFAEAAQARSFMNTLAGQGIETRTHFVPLHESQYGRQFIRSCNDFSVERGLGQRLVRLPLSAAMPKSDQDQVLAALLAFFGCEGQIH